jgi:release factor glutamine methyltransferase
MCSANQQYSWATGSLLHWAKESLESKGIDSPRLTAEILLSHALGCSRVQLQTRHDQAVAADETKTFLAGLERRLQHEPLQHIIGEAEFMGLSFHVDGRVLVPRPETEVLVEEVLRIAQTQPRERRITVLDVGTGSGNIAVAIAKVLKQSQIFALEIDPAALKVTEMNVRRHAVSHQVTAMQRDIFQPLESLEAQSFDFVVANPPYVSSEEFLLLPPEVGKYEPRIATCDEGDGLKFFPRLADVGSLLLRPGGWIVVETAYNQRDAVTEMFFSRGYESVKAVKDYSGNQRVVEARKRP